MEIYVQTNKEEFLLRSIFHTLNDYMHKSGSNCNLDDEELGMLDKLGYVNVIVKSIDRYISLEELDFSVRTYNVLKRYGVNSLDELGKLSDEELEKVKNIGQLSLNEIRNKLSELGIK